MRRAIPRLAVGAVPLGLALLGVALLVLPMVGLRAQAFCSGPNCASLPPGADLLNALPASVKLQYSDRLAVEMARASEAGNLLGLPLGPVALDANWTAGMVASLGYEEKHNVLIVSPFGAFSGIDSGGYSLNPKLFFGANAGWLHRSLTGRESQLLERFEGYLSYFNRTLSEERAPEIDLGRSLVVDAQKASQGASVEEVVSLNPLKGLRFKENRRLDINLVGLEARYRVWKAGRPLGFSSLTFSGLVLGAGIYRSRADLEVIQGNKDVDVGLGNGRTLVWDSFGQARYRMRVRSFPLEVRSGVRLWRVAFSVAPGISVNRGHLGLTYFRVGRIYLRDSNPFAGLGDSTNSYLSLGVQSQARIAPLSQYLKLGLELDFPYAKLAIEGVWTREAEGLSVGLRFAPD